MSIEATAHAVNHFRQDHWFGPVQTIKTEKPVCDRKERIGVKKLHANLPADVQGDSFA